MVGCNSKSKRYLATKMSDKVIGAKGRRRIGAECYGNCMHICITASSIGNFYFFIGRSTSRGIIPERTNTEAGAWATTEAHNRHLCLKLTVNADDVKFIVPVIEDPLSIFSYRGAITSAVTGSVWNKFCIKRA